MIKNNLFVIGLQWGDEGKGKIVDSLASSYQSVMRFQGGNNAGHTIVVEGKQYKFSVLPSGVLHNGVKLVVGSGVLLDLSILAKEVQVVEKIRGSLLDDLYVSDLCHLILPCHIDLDRIYESWRGENSIGTTFRGIGPCCEDRVVRRGIRIIDLKDLRVLKGQLEVLVGYHNRLRSLASYEPIKSSDLMDQLMLAFEPIKKFVVPDSQILRLSKGKGVIFEGAQGFMLDIDYGTYPYVTSTSMLLPPPLAVGDIYGLGVVKAYCTRVGNGPFMTEQDNEEGFALSERGKEFGTVTGRRRRCGWLDLVALQYAVKVSGVSGIALTKLDVLSGMHEVSVCAYYSNPSRGVITSDFSLDLLHSGWEPAYQMLPGWDWVYNESKREFHPSVTNYISAIEQILEVPVVMVSTGPDRNDYVMNSVIG